MTRILLVAGEASGDLHGSLLARELRRIDPDLELFGIGGPLMEGEGVSLLARSGDLAVTGLFEVLSHLPRIRHVMRMLVRAAEAKRPDLFVPIDYPDFNLRLAGMLHRRGVPVVYYISPQIWAWRPGRIHTIGRIVRRMLVIFPFEEAIYRREGIPVSYVGHALAERVRPERSRPDVRAELGITDRGRLIVLLPGSRRSEVDRLLPAMMETRDRLRDMAGVGWAVALAPGWGPEDFRRRYKVDPSLPVLSGRTYDLLNAADLAITASGTATLEAALLGTPMIVVYKMHPLTYWIARRLVRVPHIAMANLLAGARVVPEFLQGDVDSRRLGPEVRRWLLDEGLRQVTRTRLLDATNPLKKGGAAETAARLILDEAHGCAP